MPRCRASQLQFYGACQLQSPTITPVDDTVPHCQLQTLMPVSLPSQCQLQTVTTPSTTPAATPDQPTPLPDLPSWIKIGVRVYCRYHNLGTKWDFATITSVHDDKTIDFVYDNGDVETQVIYSDTRIEKVELNSGRSTRRGRRRVWTTNNFGGYADSN